MQQRLVPGLAPGLLPAAQWIGEIDEHGKQIAIEIPPGCGNRAGADRKVRFVATEIDRRVREVDQIEGGGQAEDEREDKSGAQGY
jgi:hypothetical protein